MTCDSNSLDVDPNVTVQWTLMESRCWQDFAIRPDGVCIVEFYVIIISQTCLAEFCFLLLQPSDSITIDSNLTLQAPPVQFKCSDHIRLVITNRLIFGCVLLLILQAQVRNQNFF